MRSAVALEIRSMFMSLIMPEMTMNRQPSAWTRRLICCAALCGVAAHGRAVRAQTAECRVSVCRLLTALAHDSMEGRATGSAGAHRAARFIAEQFRAAG